MAKPPALGMVKSRIALSVGNQQALEIYCQLLSMNLALLKSMQHEIHTLVNWANKPDKVSRSILKENCDFRINQLNESLQVKGDLGERMYGAVLKARGDNSRKVILIGADCPGLNRDIIRKTFTLLDKTDCVLGPAVDGGYYLLGSRLCHPGLFPDTKWGSKCVLRDTISSLDENGISYHLLKKQNDIDFIEDWNQYLKSIGRK
jgi:uncharacterized protein